MISFYNIGIDVQYIYIGIYMSQYNWYTQINNTRMCIIQKNYTTPIINPNRTSQMDVKLLIDFNRISHDYKMGSHVGNKLRFITQTSEFRLDKRRDQPGFEVHYPLGGLG